MSADDLSSLRAAVDDADRAIVAQLARRRSAVDALARHKRDADLPATDATREEQLRAMWRAEALAHGLPDEVALAVLDAVLATSRQRVVAIVAGEVAPKGADPV